MKLDIVCFDEKYLPSYANSTDGCMDLKVRLEGKKEYCLVPNAMKVFGTGIKVSVPEGKMMKVYPRSSTGIKLRCNLADSVAIIDSGYRGEVKLAIHNVGNTSVLLEDGQRIAQFEVCDFDKIHLNVVPDDEKFRNGDRGGGIGSTGK